MSHSVPMRGGRQNISTRHSHRVKFVSQKHGAVPDLLSNLPKPSKHPPAKAEIQKTTVARTENDILCFKEAPDEREDGYLFKTEEILERAQETDCSCVFEIELRGHGLIAVPDLKKFSRTRILDLSANRIRRISHLFGVKDLRELKLYDNEIKILEGLDELKELIVLQLQYNTISSIGAGLSKLKKLRHLRLDSNCLQKVVLKELCSCSHLKILDLSFNNLESIDAVLCLSNLEELYASNNRIRSLPELNRLMKLMELRLDHNCLADSHGVNGAVNLRILDLSYNMLFSLKGIGKLCSLEYLNLSGNHLQEVQHFSESFPNVDVLHLGENRLEDMEKCLGELAQMPALSELCLSNNPMSTDLTTAEVFSTLPCLEMLNGQTMRRALSERHPPGSSPLMRPMSASTAISTKFVENQVAALKEVMDPFELKVTSCYANLRQSIDQLPTESLTPRRTAMADESPRLPSRCSRRNRIQEAQKFARSMNFNS